MNNTMFNIKAAENVPYYPVVSSGNIAKARCCEKYLANRFMAIDSQNAGTSERLFYKKILSVFKAGLSEGISKETLKESVAEYIENETCASWYDFIHQYEDAKTAFKEKFSRLADYIFDNELKTVKTDCFYEVPFGKAIGTDKWCFDTIRDCADFIFKQGDTIRLVKVQSKTTELSSRARTDENRPYLSPELLALKAGFVKEYPSASAEIWTLSGKDDKNGYFPPFEVKAGKNIISCDFTSADYDELKKRIELSLTVRCSHADCTSCRHRKICRMQSSLRVTDEEKAEQNVSSMAAAHFTDAQRTIIEHIDGPMAGIAVPGSGKTRALVERTARLIAAGIPAENILLVSFTKKACKEISGRLSVITQQMPEVKTLNQFGYDILRAELGAKKLTPATASDKKAMIDSVLNESRRIKGYSYNGAHLRYGITGTAEKWFEAIDKNGFDAFRAANQKMDEETLASIQEAYLRFRKIWTEGGYITFDEQISLVNDLFEEHPELIKKYADKYRYIMVDEYQDVNEQQVKMLYAIAHVHNNIVVMGDDDQAIYGWRGGDNKYLMNFGQEFPSAEIVYMCDNFRSNEPILKSCNSLISRNDGTRMEKAFIAHHAAKNRPTVLRNFDALQCVQLVATAVKSGIMPGEIAIIGKTNKILANISLILEEAGFKAISPKDYVIDDPVFIAVKSILALKRDMNDDMAFAQFLRICGVGYEWLYKVDRNLSLYENYKLCGFIKDGREKALLEAAADKEMNVVNTSVDNEFFSVGFQNAVYMMSTLVRYAAFEDDFASFVRAVCNTVFGVTSHVCMDAMLDLYDEHNCSSIEEFYALMEKMEKYSDETRVGYTESAEYVNLLTAHDSKGKEFSTVIVYGLEDYEDSPEEIRLLFVAMSRAKKNLFITEGICGHSALLNTLRKECEVR